MLSREDHIRAHGVSFTAEIAAREIYAELTGDREHYDLTLCDEPCEHGNGQLDWLLDRLLDVERAILANTANRKEANDATR